MSRTTLKEMVLAFLSDDVFSKVNRQFTNGTKILSVTKFEMKFRLYRSKSNIINFEILVDGPIGKYFQPVGYFSQEGQPTILREFEEAYDELRSQKPRLRQTNKMDTEASALIAAFSARALYEARKEEDARFIANGMEMEIWISLLDENPQVFAADKYNVEGALGSYQISDNQFQFAPTVKYKDLFDDLYQKELFTIAKSLQSEVSGIKQQSSDESSKRDLSEIEFISSDHIRYENGRDVSGHNRGCMRGLKVENNINGGEGYTVTLHNLDGPHPVWGNNVQMAPKQMRVIREEGSEVELRGFGTGRMGGSFSDYGVTLYFDGGDVEKAVLHMHDRNVDIEYLKGQKGQLDDDLPF